MDEHSKWLINNTHAIRKAAAARNAELKARLNARDEAYNQRAASHFLKALHKHPRFADALFDICERNKRVVENEDYLREICDLEETREDIYLATRDGTLEARYLLSCEIEEAHVEYLRGDKAACVDELYDAVAVLMRMIAVVEGKQKLGGER